MEILRPLPPSNTNVSKSSLQTEATRSGTRIREFEDRRPAMIALGHPGSSCSANREVLTSISSTFAEAYAESGIELSGYRLSFSMDEDTGTTVINIIDNRTDEVVRQIPPDEMLSLKKRMGEIQGLLLDRKA